MQYSIILKLKLYYSANRRAKTVVGGHTRDLVLVQCAAEIYIGKIKL